MLRDYLKRWLYFLALVVFNGFLGIKTSIGFFYFFFWFLLVLISLSLLWVALEYAVLSLHFTRSVPVKAEEADRLEIKATIENKSFLPVFGLVVEDNLACDPKEQHRRILFKYISPRSKIKMDYFCSCPRRGRYSIGPFAVYLFDPFGLLFLKKKYYEYSEVYVYPKIFKIKNFPALVKGNVPWFGLETARFSGDEDEFFGIREYKQGDPIKKIHWASTARKNSLMVKQFQRQVFYRATILFCLDKEKNLGSGLDTVAEYTVKLAASVAKHLLERDVSLELIAYAEEPVRFEFNKGAEHLEDILKFLSIAQPQNKVGWEEIFQTIYSGIQDYSTLIVIMLDKDWEYLAPMLMLSRRDVSFVPLVLVSSTFLYSIEKEDVVKDVGVKLSGAFNLNPILFCRGDNLEEAFFKPQARS